VFLRLAQGVDEKSGLTKHKRLKKEPDSIEEIRLCSDL